MLSQFQCLQASSERNDRHCYLWTLVNMLGLVFCMANEAGLETVLSAAYSLKHETDMKKTFSSCRWVAYVHTHRVTEIPINKTLPYFGDVVVVHQAFKKPPSFENRGVTSGDWKGVLLEGVLVANCRKFFMRVTKLKPTLGSPLVSSMCSNTISCCLFSSLNCFFKGLGPKLQTARPCLQR